jgi:hypothetical protein
MNGGTDDRTWTSKYFFEILSMKEKRDLQL